MKKIFLLILSSILFIGCKTKQLQDTVALSKDIKEEVITEEPKEIILIGQHSKSDLQQEPYANWFNPEEKSYVPNKETLFSLRNINHDYTITIFMGTWCDDSKQQVPRFYKILNDFDFDLSKVKLITVDKSKTTPEKHEEGLNITNVPTFIFYKDKKELNRIVESPVESLEKDMFKIITEQPYRHIYEN